MTVTLKISSIYPFIKQRQFPRSKTPPPVSPKKIPPAPPPRRYRAEAKVVKLSNLHVPRLLKILTQVDGSQLTLESE